MSDSSKTLSSDEERLAALGYKQELNRGWSGFSNFAISLTIICSSAAASRPSDRRERRRPDCDFDRLAADQPPVLLVGLFDGELARSTRPRADLLLGVQPRGVRWAWFTVG